ncbi:uncharacterized protein PRCAT00004176001 [Priceomyces carsonii]|uniref:uncharacterized protein n=1 Tax=Priceomyces carsonii TaxID=28549 RepID=UPI002ED8C140|nr:unnamed protein product [Priceomyces carsonii]
MSINYNNVHRADIPITNLDDSEDDLDFNYQEDRSSRNNTTFIDDLDFEISSNDETLFTRLGKKVSSFFKKSSTGYKYNSLDHSISSDSFDLERENEPQSLRNYGIPRLQKRLRVMAGLLVALILVIIVILICFPSNVLSNHAGGLINKTTLSNSTHDFHPTTLVISLDGFHPHYISAELTPTLHQMMVHGYGAPYMIPSFPSSTFPNHWTLVTGLYPSEHGIVGNTFYDPELRKQFINTNPTVGGLDPDFWRGGEPIWKTAYDQNITSAVHMWPGSEVPGIGIGGGPLEVDKFNGSEVLSSKVDRVMTWLDRADIDLRPELILTYVPTIDEFGHKYGIGGKNISNALTYVDDFINLLKLELRKRNLTNIVNMIIVSDHGMAPTSNDRLLYLDDLIDLNKIEHIDGWPLFGLRPKKGYLEDEILQEMQSRFEKMDAKIRENYDIYRVQDIPKEWEFGGSQSDHKFNYRLAPLWIIPRVGYSITTYEQMKENGNDYKPKGVHGYNNTELLMRALFLGSGPYFDNILKKGLKIKPFQNTEVYNFICDTLSITPSPNNGTFDKKRPLISTNNYLPKSWRDDLGYPNLPFEVDHIVKDSTYDQLWRKEPPQPKPMAIPTNENPYLSMIEVESTLVSMQTQKLPKPTDFVEAEPSPSSGDASEEGKLKEGSKGKEKIKGGINGIIGDIFDDLKDIGEDVEKLVDDATDKVEEFFDDNSSHLKL